MRVELITAPANPATTLSDVKTYAFMNTSGFDTKINSLIEPATKYLENHIGRKLITQTLDIFYDADEYKSRLNAYNDSLVLYTFNVQSITEASTYDEDNNNTIINSADYRLQGNQLSSENNLVFNQNATPPYANIRDVDGVKIRVVAGYGATSADIPDDLKQALAVLIEHWVRDGQKSSTGSRTELPTNFINLVAPYMSMEGFIG